MIDPMSMGPLPLPLLCAASLAFSRSLSFFLSLQSGLCVIQWDFWQSQLQYATVPQPEHFKDTPFFLHMAQDIFGSSFFVDDDMASAISSRIDSFKGVLPLN